MKRVIIESPYAGDVDRNLRYLRACLAHSIKHDEAPFASHGLYTQPGVLDDDRPVERELGIVAGFAWRDVAELTVVYTDLGISKGMQYGIDDAVRKGRPVEYRELGGEWAADPESNAEYIRRLRATARALGISCTWCHGSGYVRSSIDIRQSVCPCQQDSGSEDGS